MRDDRSDRRLSRKKRWHAACYIKGMNTTTQKTFRAKLDRINRLIERFERLSTESDDARRVHRGYLIHLYVTHRRISDRLA